MVAPCLSFSFLFFCLFSLYSAWENYKNIDVDSSEGDNTSPANESSVCPFRSIFPVRSKRRKTADELEAYLTEQVEEAKCDVLKYWKSKEKVWPRLSLMAKDHLAITASSASSERVFNTGRDLLGITRHRLLPTSMETCILLRSWLKSGVVILSDAPNTSSPSALDIHAEEVFDLTANSELNSDSDIDMTSSVFFPDIEILDNLN